MKKMTAILSLVFVSSTVFGSELVCKIKVSDSSNVGRIENGKAVVIKEGQSSQVLDTDGAKVAYSLPSSEWHDYSTLSIYAQADSDGRISSAEVADEIKNIIVPMSISSNRKSSQLSYSHGRVLGGETSELLDIDASCEVK